MFSSDFPPLDLGNPHDYHRWVWWWFGGIFHVFVYFLFLKNKTGFLGIIGQVRVSSHVFSCLILVFLGVLCRREVVCTMLEFFWVLFLVNPHNNPVQDETGDGRKFLSRRFTFLESPIFLVLKMNLPTTSLKSVWDTKVFQPSLEPPNRGKTRTSPDSNYYLRTWVEYKNFYDELSWVDHREGYSYSTQERGYSTHVFE